MKPKYSLLLIILSLIIPVNVFAASRTITVNWSMPNSTVGDIKDYILNYSTNSDMSGATQQSCEPWQQTGSEGDQTTFSMTCNNVPIVTGQIAYFTLEAIKTDGSSLTSSVFTKDTKITLVQNFTILTPSANIPPTAHISTNTTSGSAPLTVIFDGVQSFDPDGNIVQYIWNFGDGNNATGSSVTHQYAEVGLFNVSLKVIDNNGGTGTDFQNITTTQATGIEKIGNLSKETSPKYVKPTELWAYKLPAKAQHTGILKSISIEVDGLGAERRFKLALYTHDAVHNLPGDLVTGSLTVEGIATGNEPQLITLELENGAPQIIAGAQYWVGIQALDPYLEFYRGYNENESLAYKAGSVYDWSNWNGSADGVYPNPVGQCYITIEY